MTFKLRSGNNIVGKNGRGVLFKKMGSSPTRDIIDSKGEGWENMPTSEYDPDIHGVAGPDQDPKTKDIASQIDLYNPEEDDKWWGLGDDPYKTKSKKYNVNMADLPHGSQERAEEYDKRGWAHDSTTYGHKDYVPTKIETKPIETIKTPEAKLELPTKTVEQVQEDQKTKGFSLDNYDISTYRGRVAARGELERLKKSGEIDESTRRAHREEMRKKRWSNFKEKLNKIVKPKKRTVKKKKENNKKKENKKEEVVVINKGGGKQESEITGPTS